MLARRLGLAILALLLTCESSPATADEAAVLAWKNARLFDLSYTESAIGPIFAAAQSNKKQLRSLETRNPWMAGLHLTDEQMARLKLAANEIFKQQTLASQAWAKGGEGAKEGTKLDAQIIQARKREIENVLTAEQQFFLKRSLAQKKGLEIFTDPIVAAAAGLSPEQITQLAEAQKDTETALAAVELPSSGSSDSFGEKTVKPRPTAEQKQEDAKIRQQQKAGEARYRAAEKKREERFSRIITADQLNAWKALIASAKK